MTISQFVSLYNLLLVSWIVKIVKSVVDAGFAADAMDIYAYHARRRPRFAGTADYASRSMLHCKPTTFYDDLGVLVALRLLMPERRLCAAKSLDPF